MTAYIQQGSRVDLEYSVFLQNGTLIDTNIGGAPLTVVIGETNLIPAVAALLIDMQAGDEKEISLAPHHAYGDRDSHALFPVDTNLIPSASRKIGSFLILEDESGQHYHGAVAEVAENQVIVDLNHPLAGQTLTIMLKVLDVQND